MKKSINKMLLLVVLGVSTAGVNAGWISSVDSDIQSAVDKVYRQQRQAERDTMYSQTNKLLKSMSEQARLKQAAIHQKETVKNLMAEIRAEAEAEARAEMQGKQLGLLIKDAAVARAEKAQAEQYAYLTKLVGTMIKKTTNGSKLLN